MIAGQLVAIIGNVFLARLTVDTKTTVWATILVVTGLGTGMGLQMPFTGVQLVLELVITLEREQNTLRHLADQSNRRDDIPVGNGKSESFET